MKSLRNSWRSALVIALGVVTLHHSISAAMALLIGIAMALTIGNPLVSYTRKVSQKLLMISVVGLGAGMNLKIVGQVGLQGIGYTVVTIILTMIIGMALGRLLKNPQDTSILISSGTAICGGSAIAAVAVAIEANSADTSMALATVFLLNATALFIFPWLGHHFNFTQIQFGLWSALAVHDTSSVVGTSLQYGPHALQIGTTVKLARALWIAPLTLFIGVKYKKDSRKKAGVKIPWFIFGFVIAAALVTWNPALQEPGFIVAAISRRLLVLTLFFIGAGLTMETLKGVGFKPLLQGFLLWVLVAFSTAIGIYEGLIKFSLAF